MKIIISPAKKMNQEPDLMAPKGLPVFLDETRKIYKTLNDMSWTDLQALWKCNDKLTDLNVQRLQDMNLERNLTPAILSYEGLQYQYMHPAVFTDDQVAYVEKHLRILSGFYGVLRPFDGVTPYRLEMQARLCVDGVKDLYDFWGKRLYDAIRDDDGIILNLASKEYEKAVSRYLIPEDQMITFVFGELKDDKVIEKGTFAKMARGEMVSFLSANDITDSEGAKEFAGLNFSFDQSRSTDQEFIFLR